MMRSRHQFTPDPADPAQCRVCGRRPHVHAEKETTMTDRPTRHELDGEALADRIADGECICPPTGPVILDECRAHELDDDDD